MPVEGAEFAARLKAEAQRIGFDRVGIAPAVRPPGFEHYQEWLEAGYEAGMTYMRKHEAARSHPESILEGVRSVIVGAIVYGEKSEPSDDPKRGKIARYAQGGDYHKVLWRKLEALFDWLRTERPEIHARAVTDTAPLLERDFAQLAGIGWIGKNTMLINRQIGSFTVLGALLVDQELAYDAPSVTNHCGTCTRCLDACPTAAFNGPNSLDANKCLSYWTIEHRGPIPVEIAEKLDGWAFGCDICQDVCPWNRKAPNGREPNLGARSEWTNPDLLAWLEQDAHEFGKSLAGTALKRTKRAGLIRNAVLILGARGVKEALPVIERLRDEPDEGVREAVAWVLGLPQA
jgi:epoxyqueuosine reductase